MNKGKYNGFTLVELIIVVTILSILATISFVSFKGYTKSARDSNRLATLRNIDTGLQTYYSSSQKYPLPENYITLLSTGNLIGYQGYFGDDTSRLIKISKTPIDPLDSEKYTYSVNSNQNSFQVLTFLENGNNISLEFPEIIDKTYAAGVDYSSRYPKSSGKDLGILLGASGSYINTPLQELKSTSFSGIDVMSFTGNIGGTDLGSLKAVFKKESDSVSGTGDVLVRLENIYKQKVQVVMDICPNGWTEIGYPYVKPQSTFIPLLYNGLPFKICENTNTSKIPKLSQIVMVNCSDSWVETGTPYVKPAATAVNLGYVSGNVNSFKICQSTTDIVNISKGSKLIMTSCPTGFTDIGIPQIKPASVFIDLKGINSVMRTCEKN